MQQHDVLAMKFVLIEKSLCLSTTEFSRILKIEREMVYRLRRGDQGISQQEIEQFEERLNTLFELAKHWYEYNVGTIGDRMTILSAKTQKSLRTMLIEDIFQIEKIKEWMQILSEINLDIFGNNDMSIFNE